MYIDNEIGQLRRFVSSFDGKELSQTILVLFYEDTPLSFISYVTYQTTIFITQIQGIKIRDRNANVISKFNYSQSLIKIVEEKISLENTFKKNKEKFNKIIGIGLNLKITNPSVHIEMFTEYMNKFIKKFEDEIGEECELLLKKIFTIKYKEISFYVKNRYNGERDCTDEDLLHYFNKVIFETITNKDYEKIEEKIGNYEFVYYYRYLVIQKDYYLGLSRYDESFKALNYSFENGFYIKSI